VVVHEQSWSSIGCLLWWSSIVSSFFLEVNNSKIILSFPFPFLCYSFCLLLSSILLASSPWFLWYFYGILTKFLCKFYVISMIFLWDFYGISEGMLWEFNGILVGFPLGSYEISMVFLWCFYGISAGFLWDSYGIPMAFLWEFHDVSMIFLWDYFGMSTESKLKSIDNKFKLNWHQMKIHWK